MLELENLSGYELDSVLFDEIFATLANTYMPSLAPSLCLEVLITDSAHMREINKAHRNQDKPTDVLSFPLSVEYTDVPTQCTLSLGSVVLNAELAAEIGINIAIFVFGPVSWLIMLGIALATSLIATFLPVYSIARRRPVDSIRAI